VENASKLYQIMMPEIAQIILVADCKQFFLLVTIIQGFCNVVVIYTAWIFSMLYSVGCALLPIFTYVLRCLQSVRNSTHMHQLILFIFVCQHTRNNSLVQFHR
jgi:hypothetical protein